MFFTAEDERARMRGSVDPLGLLPVFLRFEQIAATSLTIYSPG